MKLRSAPSPPAIGERRRRSTYGTNVRVHRFVLRLVAGASLAKDIVSEVFLALWRQAGAFKVKSQVSTWILAIARYKALHCGAAPTSISTKMMRRRLRIRQTMPRQ